MPCVNILNNYSKTLLIGQMKQQKCRLKFVKICEELYNMEYLFLSQKGSAFFTSLQDKWDHQG